MDGRKLDSLTRVCVSTRHLTLLVKWGKECGAWSVRAGLGNLPQPACVVQIAPQHQCHLLKYFGGGISSLPAADWWKPSLLPVQVHMADYIPSFSISFLPAADWAHVSPCRPCLAIEASQINENGLWVASVWRVLWLKVMHTLWWTAWHVLWWTAWHVPWWSVAFLQLELRRYAWNPLKQAAKPCSGKKQETVKWLQTCNLCIICNLHCSGKKQENVKWLQTCSLCVFAICMTAWVA